MHLQLSNKIALQIFDEYFTIAVFSSNSNYFSVEYAMSE